MRNIYKVSLNDLNIPDAYEVFEAISHISRKYNEKFFLIGALARDTVFIINKQPIQRATLDIDFAVVLSHWHQYDKIMNELAAMAGFEKTREPH
jgi:predicted nucleotidyltransferase